MAWTRAHLLQEGEVDYKSTVFDLYFVRKKMIYVCRGKEQQRMSFFTFGMGRHRAAQHKIIRLNHEEYAKKLQMCRMYDDKQKNGEEIKLKILFK